MKISNTMTGTQKATVQQVNELNKKLAEDSRNTLWYLSSTNCLIELQKICNNKPMQNYVTVQQKSGGKLEVSIYKIKVIQFQ